ncbi:aldo/keto reductase [Clostridium thermosuccinogenes]|uniref:Aldo/keto reductase n=1 Tax=Clostridium thermosuccinogenes TaxID=84032 RepID=A0A2K2FQP9_9CLOT|nr:aldo/keto reductase [Pseudoclostridium thermosuccinogenes]AUS96031.1 aldo/keto reductase [Pseudoclostridium thermosuccinogenes]PNT93245.1 aldo/keto reductase [Pseudoclostridium thermosuccinogenes]PNT99420.1 aldo/keto reductase [Pseudoclostridium thermosuccinogenes]PNU01107.1 aldo/keto reductase [Pseudoclostridium thermosuccinogenes]
MQYKDFGKTGIKISALGFGAMRLPQTNIDGKSVFDTEKSIEMIHRAFELGVNYIDTAPGYCNGESEIIVGKALKGWRDKVYLSTKNPIEDDSGDHYRERLEKSLRKLDVDYIDFYHMWGINWDTYVNKIDVKNGPLQAAFKAKEEGLIKHISFSFHDKPENMIKIIDTGNFETVLCQYNLLDRSNEEAIAYAKEKGLGVVVMGPVGGGRLGSPSEVIRNLLPGKVSSSPEVALRFVLSNPGVSCALSGMSTIEMVEENARIASNESPLSEAEVAAIKASMEENRRMAGLYCTGCNYCMPCPQEVNIPLNFQLMNYHRVYGLTEHAREQYKKIGTVDWMKGKKAEECVECGLCEEKCPQKLKIREQLKETAKALA